MAFIDIAYLKPSNIRNNTLIYRRHKTGQQLHLQQQLTFYVARHSWASIARSMDIPLPIISEGMGHDSERTTQIYLKSLDFNRIDSINASIISAVEEQKNDV